ncbi:class I SAM-dependent DNA methyltransferase [Micromonospora halophytica]|uniref:Methyltransferase domain-containing protein n=1 Tax=Micromonospora halophytica TaxID=47864 RepID=A0A1C5JES9_9ACTN|nr:class I SAM-dependent methyltransferase [Micromonospora halophytica]SCG69008.1 Methyltransferase domain-containing protein [Micromonospora halophytica]
MTAPDFLTTTRASYDTMAADYTGFVAGELAARPLERALLAAFAETVRAGGGGPVLEVGCGNGRITRHLSDLGLDVGGLDLSPGMIAEARRLHPDLRFTVGSMLDLDQSDGALAGLVAWYSVIHLPDDRLPAAFAGFHRVLAPGGHALLAFQVGDEPVHRTDAWGHEVDLVFHRRRPERVAALLEAAGLQVRARLCREPEQWQGRPEPTAQAFLMARRPG